MLNCDPSKGAVQQLRQKGGGANQLGAVPQATARQEEAVVSKVGVRCEVLQGSEGGVEMRQKLFVLPCGLPRVKLGLAIGQNASIEEGRICIYTHPGKEEFV